MRLIDADALTKVLRIQEDEWGTPDETWMPESDYGRVIKSMPTIDPVKHGRWQKDRYTLKSGEQYIMYQCSECGARFQEVGYGWPYCPECGARMDGGGESDKD